MADLAEGVASRGGRCRKCEIPFDKVKMHSEGTPRSSAAGSFNT